MNGANAVRDTAASANAERVETGNERVEREIRGREGDAFDKIKGDSDRTKVKGGDEASAARDKDRESNAGAIADMARRLGISMRRAKKEMKRQQIINRAAEGTPFEPGRAMARDTAQDKVVEMYKNAFPGIQFTDVELAKPIELLATGKISEADLQARVNRGAELVLNPNAIKKALADGGTDPHRASIGAQQMRLAHMLGLMRQGILPEGKFNIGGAFMYVWKGHNTEGVEGRYLRATNARQAGSSSGSTSSSTSGSTARRTSSSSFSATSSSPRPSGSVLIQGSSSNSMFVPTDKEANRRGGSVLDIPNATSSSLSETLTDLSGAGAKTNSPVMLDLNHDGGMGVTGDSTARDRAGLAIKPTVDFDIDGDGDLERIEWMNGDGDAMLVDDRDGGATSAAAGDGVIDGRRLFGDQGGTFANGYEKMEGLDANGDGRLTGTELDGLKAWVDDGDAVVETGELKTLVELGVTELSLKMELTANERGEMLMRSTFTQDGVQHVSEDVWFGEDADSDNLVATTARVAAGIPSQTLDTVVALVGATIGELDSVAREAEHVHANTTLASRYRMALVTSGFRA
ncbi:MAG: hypothetical protein ACAI38_12500 [Myxococcota bacterium]|nr:hypothetical protein [Myxococcota bacterium]